MRKTATVLFGLILLYSFFPVTIIAADSTISIGGTYDLASYGSGSVITIATTQAVTLTQTNSSTALTNFSIVCSVPSVNLSINEINIDNTAYTDKCPLIFTGADNTLSLSGASILTAGANEPGILVESGTTLIIDGTGSIIASGGLGGAGIGGGKQSAVGALIISGGASITAYAGEYASGIGSGQAACGGSITIEGSTHVTATGGIGAAAIGTGENESGSTYSGCDITITGGTVTANGNEQLGTGIGGGVNAPLGNILISDGRVLAYGGDSSSGGGPGIGTSANAFDIEDTIPDLKNGSITISGGEVFAWGGRYCAGVGAGFGSPILDITISGGSVTSEGGRFGAAIGGGFGSNSLGTISINGGTVFSLGGMYSAGIGAGYNSDESLNIEISGDSQITTMGGTNAPGIGESYHISYISNTAFNIEINGNAQVTSTGGSGGSGIGNGANCGGGTILISDTPYITATAGGNGAGIGGGNYGAGSFCYISGGVVMASGTVGQDIGKGADGSDEGYLEITGQSTVFLKNDYCAAPNTSLTHFSYTLVDSSGRVLGVKVPSGWLGAGGYYWDALSIVYNSNGGSGAAPTSQTVVNLSDALFTAKDNGTLYLEGACFSRWNTSSDGSGTNIYPDNSYQTSSDITLYAIWQSTVSSLTLDKTAVTIRVSSTEQLTAEILPSAYSSNTIYWTSSSPTIAGVTQDGLVTGISSGTATITAYSAGKTAICEVTVKSQYVSSVNLNYNEKTLYEADVFVLTAEVLPDSLSYTTVSWDTSDYLVATVNSSGIVTAQGTGTCTITASAGGESDTCLITVESIPLAAVSNIIITIESDFSALLYINETLDLKSYILPCDASVQITKWQSSDSSVLSVDSNGKVTAINEGQAFVTAKAQDISSTFKITVKSKVNNEDTSSDNIEKVSSEIPAQIDKIYTIEINASELPLGTEYLILPNGEIVYLSGNNDLSVVVSEENISDGTVNLFAMDNNNSQLGSVTVETSEKKSRQPILLILLIVFILLLIVLSTITIKRISNKKRS